MTSALAIPEPERTELAAEASAAPDMLATLHALTLATQADLDFAGSLLVEFKARWKALEERRTAITRPMHEAKRAVDGLFGPVQGPLEEAEKILKKKIGDYQIAQRAAQAEAMRAVARGDEGAALVLPSAAPEGVSVRAVWRFEVVDEAEVPRRFLTVDHAALRRHCAFADTPRTPPLPVAGVRFFLDGQVTVRT